MPAGKHCHHYFVIKPSNITVTKGTYLPACQRPRGIVPSACHIPTLGTYIFHSPGKFQAPRCPKCGRHSTGSDLSIWVAGHMGLSLMGERDKPTVHNTQDPAPPPEVVKRVIILHRDGGHDYSLGANKVSRTHNAGHSHVSFS